MIQIELPSFKVDKKAIVSEDTFKLLPGTIHGILGKSGSGKSMLLKMISGEYKKKALLKDPGNSNIQFTISMYPSNKRYIHEETIDELIDSEKKRRKLHQRSIAYNAKERRSIISFLGLSSYLEKKIGEVNDTMLKKAYLARTLTDNSDIYLLDNPETSLDINSRIQISKLIKHLAVKKNKNIIIASNDINFLTSICDSYIAIKNGKIESTGSISMLNKSILESIYETNMLIHKNVVTGKIEVSFYHHV